MTNENPKQPMDEMTPALRKALVESGAIIPTTPEEVLLAEKQLTVEVKPSEVEAGFKKLEAMLHDSATDLSFMRLDESAVPQQAGGLAMAARNGTELDEETRAKIEASVRQALPKSPKDRG